MKQLLTALLCCACSAASSQNGPVYLKTFQLNKDAVYITNSARLRLIAFAYNVPADTANAIFLIENFKQADVEFAMEKVRFYKAKIYVDGYQTKPRDFVYSITSENKLLYFFHKENIVPSNSKIN